MCQAEHDPECCPCILLRRLGCSALHVEVQRMRAEQAMQTHPDGGSAIGLSATLNASRLALEHEQYFVALVLTC